MKHNSNLDVRGDLKIQGRVRDNLLVEKEVVAAAFYIASGGNIFTRSASFIDFESGNNSFLRTVTPNDMEDGPPAAVGFSMADTISGSVTEQFRVFTGPGSIQPEIAGTKNFHIYEPTGSNTNRMLIMGPGTLSNTAPNLGIPVQHQLVLHRDGKIALGYEDLDYTNFQYSLNVNGTVIAYSGFYVTNTNHYDQIGNANIVGEFSSDRFFTGPKAQFGSHVRMEDTLNVENAVTAEAFYLESGGEVSHRNGNLYIRSSTGQVIVDDELLVSNKVVSEAFYLTTGGEVSLANAFSAYLVNDTVVTTGVDIPWESEFIKDSNFTHTANSANVVLNTSGVYRISANVNCLSSAAAYTGQINIRLNGGNMTGGINYFGNATAAASFRGASVNLVRVFNASDTIAVRVTRVIGTADLTANLQACRLTIEKLR